MMIETKMIDSEHRRLDRQYRFQSYLYATGDAIGCWSLWAEIHWHCCKHMATLGRPLIVRYAQLQNQQQAYIYMYTYIYIWTFMEKLRRGATQHVGKWFAHGTVPTTNEIFPWVLRSSNGMPLRGILRTPATGHSRRSLVIIAVKFDVQEIRFELLS